MGRQTTVRWQKQVFVHTQLSRAYLALARLSCFLRPYNKLFYHSLLASSVRDHSCLFHILHVCYNMSVVNLLLALIGR